MTASVPGLFTIQQFSDGGMLASNYRLYTYLQGTTTFKAAYTDVDGAVPHTYVSDGIGGQYIALNARGELPAPLYIDNAAAYDITLKRPDGSTVWTRRADAMFSSVKSLASDLASTSTGKGSKMIAFILRVSGAVARWVEDKLEEIPSIRDFGAASSNTASQNLAAFKAAVAATKEGGRLLVPVDSGPYLIDTTGGLSTAITINKRIEIVFEGDVKATFGTMQANPPYLFKVTAAGVRFSGNGRIIGNGTIDDTNSGTDDTFPGLIYVAGDNFTFFGPTIDTPPKVGIELYNCFGAKISGSTFTGGPTSYTIGNTAHFAVRMYQGGRHLISNNSFVPDASGGMFVNCVFSGQASNCEVTDNFAYRPYEKLAYLVGDCNLIADNYVLGNAGTIPGQSQAGTMTSVLRAQGSFNRISGNFTKYCLGGATILNGSNNDITDNQFIDCGQWGVTVFAQSYATPMNRNTVRGNNITGAVLSGITQGGGVLFSADQATANQGDICDNRIIDFPSVTYGAITITAVSPYTATDFNVQGNHITTCGNAVLTDRLSYSRVSCNKIENVTNYAFAETGGANNRWTENSARNVGFIGIFNFSSLSHAMGNQYNEKPLAGILTCSAAVATTIAHTGVAPNARVFLQPANAAAGTLATTKGFPVTAISGTSFTVTMANGTAAAGTENFLFNIEQ